MKTKNILLLLLMTLLLSNISNAQSFNDLWLKVDKNIENNLPRSANNILDEIENKAIKESNSVEQLKTVLYRFKVYFLNEEEPVKVSIFYAEKYLDKLQEPSKAILNMAIAGLYENYMNNYYYKIRNNEVVVGNLDEIDIKFWDKISFDKKIEECYEAALSASEQLKNTKTESYKDALSFDSDKDLNEKFNFLLEPTLYDYVLHKIIGSYESNAKKTTEINNWNTGDWWSPAKEFSNITLPESDLASIKTLRVYQLLLAFDIKHNFNEAATYNDINRLKFVNKILSEEKSYDKYFNALQNLKEANIKNDIVTSIMALQAEMLMNQAYNEDSIYQMNYVKALKICDEAIKIFPESIGAKQCKAYGNKILDKNLSFTMQNVVLPNQAIPVALHYRNVTNPRYRIYKVSQEELELFNSLSEKEVTQKLLKKISFKEGDFEIPAEIDYRTHSSLIALPKFDCGSYYIMFSKDGDFSINSSPAIHPFQVSNLSYVTAEIENGIKIYVLDRKDGNPVKGVTVNIFKKDYNYKQCKYVLKNLDTKTTDTEGNIEYSTDNSESFYINLSYGDDKLISEKYLNIYRYKESDKLNEVTYFYTDRAIYRPGQTVYFKGIILRKNFKVKELAINKNTKVVFRDANWQEITNQEFTTNEFGSFDGSFVIPLNLMNGNYSLKNESGSLSFKIEDYKRPTFEVNFEAPDKTYKLNENVILNGSVNALSGFGLDNIQYKYRIVRRIDFPFRRWWWVDMPWCCEEQIAYGEGETDNNGQFNINFNLIPEADIDAKMQPVFNYTIFVDATNASGETQSKSYTLKAGYNELIISTDVIKTINKENLNNYLIKITNMNDKPVKSEISRKFYKLTDNDRFVSDLDNFDRKLLNDNELVTLFPNFDYYAKRGEKQDKKLVYEDIILIDDKVPLFPEKQNMFTEGKYIVELSSLDDEFSKISKEIEIYDLNSNNMPFHTLCWSYIDSSSAQPDDVVNFYIGTSAKKVPVFITIKHGNEVRYSKHITLSNKMLEIPYKVKEEDRNGLTFQAFFVKYNTINIVNESISVPYDNLKLDIKLDVERRDFLPGSEETWNITIKDYRKNVVMANLMAGMYDASLDVFAKNSWDFNIFPPKITSKNYSSDNGFNKFTSSIDTREFPSYILFSYNLLSDIFLIPSQNLFYDGAPRSLAYGMHEKNKTKRVENNAVEESISYDEKEMGEKEHIEKEIAKPVLRENFNETAFFYPNLMTNEDGSVTFSFKMPDALTRWNLMTLAYTKDLKIGRLDTTINTIKPLMIMADMPRFCYEQDTLFLVANVINTSDKTCKPKAKLEVFDAITMQTVDIILSPKEIMMEEIFSGRSQSVSWKVAFKKDMSLLVFRFTALSENFSDAEQHLMPVLSNEVFMTQTYPITVKANSHKTFTFNDLTSNENERNYGLTLNFSTNPVWYAVQSLPYLAEETGQYADAVFYRLYANMMASFIANNIPNLKNYIKKWQIETPDALLSQLQKDENLKAILLQETPWVMEAKNETDQRARIVNLFDLNTMNYRNNEDLKLIRSKQKFNGGWPWFEGMPESPFITEYILTGFGKLKKMNIINSLSDDQQNIVNQISEDACKFMQNAIIEQYHKINQAYKEKYSISAFVINELYATSYFDLKDDKNFDEAKNFFLNKLEKSWKNFGFATQAKVALVLYHSDRQKTANLIIKSLRERAQKKENIGMYWSEGNNYFHFVTQVSDQAQIMEAFTEISPKTSELDEMKIWLLTQKHTNMWESARSSVDAIYALLMQGSDWLNDNETVNIKVRNQVISTTNGEAGTGFIQKHWDAVSISSDITDINVTNSTNHIVWGGLFRQYFVPIDEVKSSNTPLLIKRELFVEKVNDKGTYLIPIENESIKVGDKITVKITFESTQDLEFVFLKDLRAACLEPVKQISSYKYDDNMFYYQSTTDTFMGFYFDNLPKGKHQISHSMYVTKEGSFSDGYALIQCLYAPEYSAYSNGIKIEVK